MGQEQIEKQSSAPQEEVEEVEEVAAKDLTNEELDADVDDILADIDDVLEENAQAFVEGFIQKGGE